MYTHRNTLYVYIGVYDHVQYPWQITWTVPSPVVCGPSLRTTQAIIEPVPQFQNEAPNFQDSLFDHPHKWRWKPPEPPREKQYYWLTVAALFFVISSAPWCTRWSTDATWVISSVPNIRQCYCCHRVVNKLKHQVTSSWPLWFKQWM